MNTELIETEEVHQALVVSGPDRAPVKFDVAKADIEKMRLEAEGLSIAGPDDKTGFETVYKLRQVVKRQRIAVEKKAKELKAPHTQYNREVDAAMKELTDPMDGIEDGLSRKETKYIVERDRIAREKALAQQQRTEGRVNQLRQLGFTWNAREEWYEFIDGEQVGHYDIRLEEIKELSDEEYAPYISTAERVSKAEQARLAEIKERADKEAKRIADEQAETARKNKAEADRLRAIADQQAADQRVIDDARKQLETDRRKMIIDRRSPLLVEVGFEVTGPWFKLSHFFKFGNDDVIDMSDEQFADLLIDAKAKVKEAADKETERLRKEAQQIAEKKAADKARQKRLAPDKKILVKFLKGILDMKAPAGLTETESTDFLSRFAVRQKEMITEFLAMADVL